MRRLSQIWQCVRGRLRAFWVMEYKEPDLYILIDGFMYPIYDDTN